MSIHRNFWADNGAVVVVSVVSLLLFLRVLYAVARRGSHERGEWPFYAKRPLSQPEQVLYHRLVQALPDRIVLAQVQVSRVLGVKKGFNFYEWNNRIDRMSYDFVVCAMDSSVLAVIELDDKSHGSESRRRADAKKDRATSAAGIRMIRWNVKAMPDQDFIREAFADWPPIRPGAHPGAQLMVSQGDVPSSTVIRTKP
jgi:very-short-patch-repair endonuclease